jgi:hypothetical protein
VATSFESRPKWILLHEKCCVGYLDHPFGKMDSPETLMEDSCLILRIDTLLLRSLTLIQFASLLEITYP